MKLFDSTGTNASVDIATMAKRRAPATGSANTGSNVYVKFEGLAELLRGSVALPMGRPARPEPDSPKKKTD